MIDRSFNVNRTAYMNFREATDGLFDRVAHEDLARALGVSVASIRQARLSAQAGGHRAPPVKWEKAIVNIANKRVEHYRTLIKQLSQAVS
jgi:hypothetical protein